MNLAIVWGSVGIFAGVLLWLLLRSTRKGAVNDFKVESHDNTEKLRRELNEIRRENDRLAADAKRKRLLKQYGRD